MPIWNKTGTKPQDLKDRAEKRNVIATDIGWVRRINFTDVHSNARTKEELLVAISGLANSTNMGFPDVDDVFFQNGPFTGEDVLVGVAFNEPVAFIDAGDHTIILNEVLAQLVLVVHDPVGEANVGDTIVGDDSSAEGVVTIKDTATANAHVYTLEDVAGEFVVDEGLSVANTFTANVTSADDSEDLTYVGNTVQLTATANNELIEGANNVVVFGGAIPFAGNFVVPTQTIQTADAGLLSLNAGSEAANLVIGTTAAELAGTLNVIDEPA